jgi:uncharacterized membrane protein SirB2
LEYYLVVKQVHIATAILSLCGFALRSWWMLKDNPLLQTKMVKIFPHINDTLLLGAAVYLTIVRDLSPFTEGWLAAKVILLVLYIVAGTVALKRGKTKQAKIRAMILALACVVSIFIIAMVKPF